MSGNDDIPITTTADVPTTTVPTSQALEILDTEDEHRSTTDPAVYIVGDTEELELGATAATTEGTGARQRILTGRGQKYQQERLQKNIRTAITKWRKQAKHVDRLVTESFDVTQLKKERDLLATYMEEISRLSEAYQAVQPEEDRFYEKIDAVEQEDHDLSRRLSAIIFDLQSETGSMRSDYSGRRSPTSGKRRESIIPAGRTEDDTREDRTKVSRPASPVPPFTHTATTLPHSNPITTHPAIMTPRVTAPSYAAAMTSGYTTSGLNFRAQPFVPRNTLQTDSMGATGFNQSDYLFPRSTTQLQPTQSRIPPTYGQVNTKLDDSSMQDPQRDSMNMLTQMLCQQASLSRLPPPEPGVFSGDHIEYSAWKTSFDLLIDHRPISSAEKLHYLRRYLSGPAKECIEGYLIGSSPNAYSDARRRLDERFGDSFYVSNAFRQRLVNWPKISMNDGAGFQKLSDFLRQCESLMESNSNMQSLNDPVVNQAVLMKLPDSTVTAWLKRVKAYGGPTSVVPSYPPLSQFSNFIAEQAWYANHPIASIQALKGPKSTKQATTNKPAKITLASSAKVTSPKESSTKDSATSKKDEAKQEARKGKPRTCIVCQQNHWLGYCDEFKKKSVSDMREFAKKKGLCFNCLTPRHLVKECRSKFRCRICQKKHATCLHLKETEEAQTPKQDVEKRQSDASSAQSTTEPNQKSKAVVSHSTRISGGSKSSMVVPVFVSSQQNKNNKVLTYALLDTQSDSSFISDGVCDELQLKGVDTQLTLSTMSAVEEVSHCKKVSDLIVCGYNDDVEIPLRTAYTRNSIPMNRNHIPSANTARKWQHLSHIAKELPPALECEIGLLIGYDCPRALTPRDVIPGPEDGPYAVKTDLGWSLVGITNINNDDTEDITHSHRIITHEVPISILSTDGDNIRRNITFSTKTARTKEVIDPSCALKMLERDFIEHKPNKKSMSADDRKFLHILNEGIHTTEDNHFEMPLPFRDSTPVIPNNRELAVKRLEYLQRRLEGDASYRKEYSSFMNQILQKGYAEEVPQSDLQKQQGVSYIPHHGVYHPRKKKLRVVFDCSAKWQGVSLNDFLLQGPDLINNLVGILCRFRKEKIAVVCDITKMFYQFRVNQEHRDFLRFLWFKDGKTDSSPTEYRMNVHLFGAVSSPGCANFGLQKAASDGKAEFGEQAANFVQHDFYVDDGLTSVATVEEAKNLITNTKALCLKKNIRLHEFASNNKEVMKDIPVAERADCLRDLDFANSSSPIERVLGIQWSLEDDCFRFRITLKDRPATRRGILSAVSAVYDPLGFLAPLILSGKRILQDICRDQTEWDAPLSEDLVSRWQNWCGNLQALDDLQIPRCYKPHDFGTVQKVELHHFSDASTTGYGSCSYLRLVDTNDKVHCSLVLGKARVTPLRPISVPRLELTAAVLSVKIADVLKSELNFPSVSEYFWTDSKVVVGYISNDARRFHVFVANRVQQIREATQVSQWHYVRTCDNPADCASRGLSANGLLNNTAWFSGPQFLWTTDWQEYTRENPIHKTINTEDPELKRCMASGAEQNAFDIDSRLARFSDWYKAKRAVAQCMRYMCILKNRIHNTKKSTPKSLLTVENLQEAERVIIRSTQSVAFPQQLRTLKEPNDNTSRLRRKDPLLKLDPQLDEDGLIRVGGKLRKSSLPLEERHPIILPKKAHVTQLIIKACHEEVSHQGRGLTLNCIRSRGYCILSSNRMVRSFISKCTYCRRWRGKSLIQKMADLPEDRMETSPPFTYCAVDYFGPFNIRIRRSDVPRYGVLFTCLNSRAIHLEVAESLETDAFINALRRLIAIRGPIRLLRSDRGTNFVGAMNEQSHNLQMMKNEKLRQFLLHHGADLEFRMNFPSSSHMGGVWERQIRTVRNVLTPMLQRSGSQLDDDSLRTLFYEVMNIVNSRPLTTDTLSDNASPAPLTPNHLLTSKTAIVLPPPAEFQEADVYSRRRWRRVQYLLNIFWSRWQLEYLQSLQQRNKWHYPQRETKVGDIVLVKDESISRNHWPLAVVEETYASSDNHVRKVKLRMSTANLDKNGRPTKAVTHLERPVHKLVLLVESPN